MEKTLFPRIKELRLELNMTQEEFAASLGLSKTAYNNYEMGIREPRSDFFRKVSIQYSVTTDYLLGLSAEKNKNSPAPVNTESEELTHAEKHLIKNLRSLNNDGQEKLLDYSDDLVASNRYIIDNSISNLA